MSDLAKQLIAEAKRTRATKLDLSWTGMTEVPEELFELEWLEELILDDQELLTSKGEGVKSNHLSAIPSKIAQLKALKTFTANGDEDKILGTVLK